MIRSPGIAVLLYVAFSAAWLNAETGLPDKSDPPPIAIAEIKRDGPVDFDREIAPLLARNCLACHHAGDAENHLNLESPQAMLKGGDSGPAVIPKQAEQSLLLKLAAHQKQPIMPPADNDRKAKPLTPDELALLKRWIDEGAAGSNKSQAAPLKWQPLAAIVNPIYAVAVSSDGQYAACGRANQIYVYHVASGKIVARLIDPALAGANGANRAHLDLVQSLAFNPAGDLLASGGFREVKLWRRPQNVHQADLTTPNAPRSLAVSADGQWAAVGDQQGAITLIDVAAGKAIKTLAGHTAAVTGLRFSGDGSRLYSGSLDKSLRAWNTADGAAAGQIDTPAAVNAITLTAANLPNAPQQIISGDADNLIRVWPLPVLPAPEAPPTPIKELKAHTGPVNTLETLTSGKDILSGSNDGIVRQWNLENGQAARQFNHGAAVWSIAMRPDGKRLVSAGANGARLWNGENAQPITDLRGDFRARGAQLKAERIVALDKTKINDAKAALKEAEDRAKKEADAIPKANDTKTAAEKSLAEKAEAAKKPAAAKLAAENDAQQADATLKVANEKADADKQASATDANNKELAKAAADSKAAAATAKTKASEAKTKLTSTIKPADLAAQDVTTAENALAVAIRGIESATLAAKKAADATPVAKSVIQSLEAQLKTHEAIVDAAKKTAGDFEQPIRSVAFSTDGQQIVSGGDNRIVHLWQSENGTASEGLEGQGEAIQGVAFAGDKIISAAANKSIVIWNPQPVWQLERTIGDGNNPEKFADRVIALDFSADGKMLATGGGEPSRSGELKIWNPADGNLLRSVPDAHSDTIFCVRFSPDGSVLATSSADRFVKTFSVADGKLIRNFEGHTHHVLGVAWKSDGKLLASCGADNVVKIWDFSSGDQKKTIEGFGKEATAISFVGDGDRMLVGSGDKSLRLYNSGGGQEKTFGGPSDFVYAAALSADGKLLIAGGQDSVLRAYSVDTAQPLKTFEPEKPAAKP